MDDRKFYVTPNRILDADVVGDVQYHPKGSPTGRDGFVEFGDDGPFSKPELYKVSELVLIFKDPTRESITLYGDEADTTWQNFRNVVGSALERA
jgi:hypothetical protein